jgi:hypothetical protein
MAESIKLKTFQTNTLLPLVSRAAGTYTRRLLIEGNSLLSTVYVNAIDGGTTVKVNYYEDTTGGDLGERKELPGHPVQSLASTNPNKITVTPFHNSPILEVIVTGGSATFSVHATVVNSFATDLDAALILDGDSFESDGDKAIPIACLDEESGQLFFMRCNNGALVSDPIYAGDAVYLDGLEESTPLVEQTLTSFTVGATKKRLLGIIKVSSFRSGTWIAEIDSATIASGRTSAGQPDSFIEFIPRREVSATSTFTLKYTGLSGPASDVHYHVMTTEI